MLNSQPRTHAAEAALWETSCGQACCFRNGRACAHEALLDYLLTGIFGAA